MHFKGVIFIKMSFSFLPGKLKLLLKGICVYVELISQSKRAIFIHKTNYEDS